MANHHRPCSIDPRNIYGAFDYWGVITFDAADFIYLKHKDFGDAYTSIIAWCGNKDGDYDVELVRFNDDSPEYSFFMNIFREVTFAITNALNAPVKITREVAGGLRPNMGKRYCYHKGDVHVQAEDSTTLEYLLKFTLQGELV